jgi:hypothetical protein
LRGDKLFQPAAGDKIEGQRPFNFSKIENGQVGRNQLVETKRNFLAGADGKMRAIA